MRKSIVPILRFKEFTDEWKPVKLGEICETFKSGESITSKDIFEAGEYPVYGGNGLRGYSKNYTHNGFYTLIGRQGALCGNINRVYGKSFISEHAIAVSTNESSDTEWLAQKLDNMHLNRLSESSAQPGLAVNKLLKIKLKVPSLLEQQKIASFLSAVDKKIQLLTRKKVLLEQYKKGVMRQLFSGKLRFKDKNGKAYPKWEEKKLGDIGETFNGLTGKTKADFGEGKPYIQYKQIFDSSLIDVAKCGFVQITKDDNQQIVNYGDIFFTTSSETSHEIGLASVLLEEPGEMYLNSFCFGFRPNSIDELVPEFAQYLFRNESFRKIIIKLAQGSTRYNMSKVELMKLKVTLPSSEEQQKIASYLSNIDAKMQGTAIQIVKTQGFKKGLLQQMFI